MTVHGYMNNSGYEVVREAIAASINHKYGTAFSQDNIIMTVGAAGGINVIFKTLLNPGDEVITFAPFFGEYRGYAANYDGKLVIVSPIQSISSPIFQNSGKKLPLKPKQ
jgi:aspartate aminotransferase